MHLRLINKYLPGKRKNTTSDLPLTKQLQWLFFLRVAVLSIFLGLSVLLQAEGHQTPLPPLPYVTYFIAFIYLFTIVSSLLLGFVKHVKRFAYLQLTIDVFLASLLVLVTGGSQSIFIIIYFFPIIAAGYMLYARGSLFLAAASTFCFGAVLVLEYRGFQLAPWLVEWQTPLRDPLIALHHFAVPGVSFFLVAFLSSYLSERLRIIEKALSRTTLNYDRLSLLYRQIFDNITSGIITVDPRGKITSFNRASEEITGYGAREVLGKQVGQFFPGFKPGVSRVFRPEIELHRENGSPIQVGYSWSNLDMPESSGDYHIFTFQDLTRIKKMENQIKQAEKMAAIGEMAAGVAHEFRNPLAAISGAAQFLNHDLEGDPVRQRLMNIIVRECDRLEATIGEFLQFSKPANPERQWFSLSSLIQDVRQLLQQGNIWPGDCRLQFDMPEKLDCWADSRQIKQVFINLISNSCNSLGEEGEIKIAAQEKEQDSQEWLTIILSDNGPGIPEHLGEKIFEPFFTTRENGTGLGLAIVRQIVEAHGGTIRLGNSPTSGAKFVILLPLPETRETRLIQKSDGWQN